MHNMHESQRSVQGFEARAEECGHVWWQELLCSVRLRQNPHNVHEWHKRVRIFEEQDAPEKRVRIFEEQDTPEKVIKAYAEAVQTVDPLKADGKPHSLWVAFARYYEDADDLDSARDIFTRATGNADDLDSARDIFTRAIQVNYRSVEDLANVWCEQAEMELRHDEFEKAMAVLHKATMVSDKVSRQKDHASLPVQQRVWKSTKLWCMYADLEESLGTLDSTKAVYERMIDLKVVTPQILINYAHMLEEAKFFEESFRVYEKGVNQFEFFEDSFRVYEKGVNQFEWPLSKELWLAYLSKFVTRYAGKKIERARDLFEQALEKIPMAESKPVFILYATLEEEHGLVKNAMAVFDRACKNVLPAERFDLYMTYIAKATEFFGVTKTRPIYEAAIQHVPDARIKDMCLKFADLELVLGEVD
ncbi:hypothetical protein T484DRAFT_1830702, partial [Baffinella frigidus]